MFFGLCFNTFWFYSLNGSMDYLLYVLPITLLRTPYYNITFSYCLLFLNFFFCWKFTIRTKSTCFFLNRHKSAQLRNLEKLLLFITLNIFRFASTRIYFTLPITNVDRLWKITFFVIYMITSVWAFQLRFKNIRILLEYFYFSNIFNYFENYFRQH